MPIISIKEEALFIADAHYPHHGDEFLQILRQLDSGERQTPQLFLMGDIFDLLFGYNHYVQTFTHEAILLLQKLSTRFEIHYMEGNHDFCLKAIFPDMYIYSRAEQPVHFRLGEREVYLAHGDRYEAGLGYELYTRVLRNRLTLTLLKPFQQSIIDYQIQTLKSKKICKKLENFETKVQKIKQHYPKDGLIIEGHFHQGVQMGNYISLPSLVCQKEIGIMKNSAIVFEAV